jgi:DHA2 family multidrug resistance protein
LVGLTLLNLTTLNPPGKGKRMSDEVGSSERWKPSVNPSLIAATFALAFMEVLDTSIANVALPHIAGDLGASADQGT